LKKLLELRSSTKKRLLTAHSIDVEGKTKEDLKNKLDEALETEIVKIGVQYAGTVMSKEQLHALAKLDDEKKFSTKAAYVKHIIAKISSRESLKDFLKNLSKEEVSDLAESLNVSDKSRTAITDEIVSRGIENFFRVCDLQLLTDCAKALDFEVSKNHTKTDLLLALSSGELPKPEKKKAPEPVKISKKKPEIEVGVSKEDLFQYYNVEDLQKWCKQHKLKTSGVKKDVIKRIISFLEGDKTGLAETKKRRKRAVSIETKKKKAHEKRKLKEQEAKSDEDKKMSDEEKKSEEEKPKKGERKRGKSAEKETTTTTTTTTTTADKAAEKKAAEEKKAEDKKAADKAEEKKAEDKKAADEKKAAEDKKAAEEEKKAGKKRAVKNDKTEDAPKAPSPKKPRKH